MKSKLEYEKIIHKLEVNLNSLLYDRNENYVKSLEEVGKSKEEIERLIFWDWTHGVGIYGIYKNYELTKEERHLDYIENWFEKRIEAGLPEKNVNTMTPLLTMAFLYEKRPKEKYLRLIEQWSQWIVEEMPKTKEGGIQHGHAELEYNGEIWDDTLFMTVLFLAKAGKLLKKASFVDEAIYQFMLHSKYLIDKKTSLWFHGWTFIERDNFAEALWARGNSWVTIFIPEFLEIVEMNYCEKKYFLNILSNHVEALNKFQDESGLWHTLINDKTSYLEASGSAGFCFGILKSIRKGYISEGNLKCGMKALDGVLQNIDENGELLNVSYGTNIGRTLTHYKEIPLAKMHYGQALAMLALIEGLHLAF